MSDDIKKEIHDLNKRADGLLESAEDVTRHILALQELLIERNVFTDEELQAKLKRIEVHIRESN